MADILIEDNDWAKIAEEAFKIDKFTAFCRIENGKLVDTNETCHAMLEITCSKLSQNAAGAVLYDTDFRHLWDIFFDRGVNSNEEVIGYWLKQDISNFHESVALLIPRMALTICPSGAYELMSNQKSRPDLGGEARFLAMKPLASWPTGIL